MSKRQLKSIRFGLALLSMVVIIVWAEVACTPASEKPSKSKTEKTLIPEDEVRMSNDPEKTTIFRDAGLGLFIHWGPNSQIGSEISWPLFNASKDYVEKYYALTKTFNPTKFDADKWARLAKLAGMEYVVFTSKHHDGFCMFDTEYSDFKITNTPHGKDVVAEIARAFRRQGLLVGFYYSPGDFRYHYETGQPQEFLMAPDFESGAPFGPQQASFLEYEQGHVKELLTQYGEIFMLWFDGKCEPLKKYAWRIKPDLFIGRGEIPTPEQTIPGEAADHAWESCMTTSWQWSYQPHPDVRTTQEIIQNLVQIRARGGNMLLNVGPRPDGTIASHDEALLRDLGLWMMSFGEAVRGIRPWTVTNEDDIWLTYQEEGHTVYAFLDLDYTAEGTDSRKFAGRSFTLKSVKATKNTMVQLLGQAGECQWSQDDQGLHIIAFNRHTLQIIGLPQSLREKIDSKRSWIWGPDWPVAIKITHVQPTE